MRERPNITVLLAGQPVIGATVQINRRSDGNPATAYQAETGGATATNPATTDAQGNIPLAFFLDRGAYNAIISGGATAAGATMGARTVPFPISPGQDGALDLAWHDATIWTTVHGMGTSLPSVSSVPVGSLFFLTAASGGNAIGLYRLVAGTPNVWSAYGQASTPVVTTLPTTGLVDGQEVVLDLGGGIKWRARYDATRAKWMADGPPLTASVDASTGATGSSWLDPNDALGPTITLPAGVGGSFLVAAEMESNVDTANYDSLIGVKCGTTAVPDGDRGYRRVTAANQGGSVATKPALRTNVAQGAVIKAQYWGGQSGTAGHTILYRRLQVWPVELY